MSRAPSYQQSTGGTTDRRTNRLNDQLSGLLSHVHATKDYFKRSIVIIYLYLTFLLFLPTRLVKRRKIQLIAPKVNKKEVKKKLKKN